MRALCRKFWPSKFIAEMLKTTYDFVVIGGGNAGCVVASRLKQSFSHLSIALIEAGPDERENEEVKDALSGRKTQHGPLAFQYESDPIEAFGGRRVKTATGRMLGGSTAVNYTAWTRGNAEDYNAWAMLTGDDRWSYDNMLPFFKRTECYHNHSLNPHLHGHDGPIRARSDDRQFPLRNPVKNAFNAVGVVDNDDINSGNPNGLVAGVKAAVNGQRENAAVRYDLEGIDLILNTSAHKILFDSSQRASAVQLIDGRTINARKEVVISCGALRTPQLLMLSGIGIASELVKHGIEQRVEAPVGANLIDHGAVSISWKLKNPEKGLALGSPAFNKPEYLKGAPIDWFVIGTAPDENLQMAAEKDKVEFTRKSTNRSDFEIPITYMVSLSGPQYLQMDGTHITTGIMCLVPTSRGTVTLKSADPADSINFNPQYFATENDKAVLRAGMRLAMRAMETGIGQEFVSTESPPPGHPQINSNSPNEDLDARIVPMAGSWYHVCGTAAMGSVVDTECRVKGVQGLRVIDASVMPLPIAAHTQAPVYAIAERAVDMLIQRLKS